MDVFSFISARTDERKGLLETVPRSRANYRIWSQQEVDRLAFIEIAAHRSDIAGNYPAHCHPGRPDLAVRRGQCVSRPRFREVRRRKYSLAVLEKDLKQHRSRCQTPGISAGCGVVNEPAMWSQKEALGRNRQAPPPVHYFVVGAGAIFLFCISG
tara:strand:+ start:120548 stop:121012 length:465 start_codon:yes stop_codon:yes gene_type:complete